MPIKPPADMLAAVYRGPDQVRIERVPVPALGPGELLVKVAACGVCGTDLKKIQLGLQAPPRIYGHETVGRIAGLGDGVEGWALGERVAVYHHIPCGECHLCRRGVPAQCPDYKRTGVTAGFEPAGGGFAGYVRVMDWIVRGGGLVRIPDDVLDAVATFVEPVNTCLKGVARAGLQNGDLAYVIGGGPIGLVLMQCAWQAGANVVISDLLPGRRALAEKLGGMAVEPQAAERAIRSRTDGRGADAVFLAAPLSRLIPEALSLLRPGGRLILFAQTRRDDPFTADAGEVCTLDKQILGSYSSDVDLNDLAATTVFERRIDVESLVSHRLPLTDIGRALELASKPSDETLKIIVEPK